MLFPALPRLTLTSMTRRRMGEREMTTVSRRGLLKGVGGIGLIGALQWNVASSAAAAGALTPTELETLRERWVDTVTGRTLIAPRDADVAAAIARLDASVSQRLAAVAPTASRFFADHDWTTASTPIANSDQMRRNYVDLATLAKAWATPGSAHEGSGQVLAVVKQGLAHLYREVYHPGTAWFGNWWSWIIGASQPLADVMAILHHELDQSAIAQYCAAIDHFVPDRDPRMQIHPSGPQLSDGANRVDICRALIVRSIVEPDTALLRASVAALSPTWQHVDSGNGFFDDGSFIQHSTIGYTGTYGTVLLDGLAKLFALLAGTTFDITDPTRDILTSAVEDSYAPFMYQGQMMDSVRGRAVSRFTERSIDDGNALIEHTLRLARAVDARTGDRWRGLCRQWITGNDAATIVQSADIVRLALVKDLMSSAVPPRPDTGGPRLFPAMDRLVYRGRDNAWALCVAMCSRRIAFSEGTDAENFRGVKTSQGMTYVYLPNADDHFDDEYWATFDLDAPVGTTVDLTALPPNPEGQWGAKTPQNEWTGGAVLGDAAVAAMHVVAPGGTGLVARKAWFVTPDAVIALGSDIATASSAEVRTVIEHRNLGASARRLVVDGVRVGSPRTLERARWAHLQGVGGYLFLDGGRGLRAEIAERTGTWQRNSTRTDPGTEVVQRRHYATLTRSHGVGADVRGEGYAYALLPGADEATTRRRAVHPPVRVLANTATVQAVQTADQTLAAAFWQPSTVAGSGVVGAVGVDQPCCVLVRREPRRLTVAVSDPARAQSTITVTLQHVPAHLRLSADSAARATLTRRGSRVSLAVDVRGTSGTTVEVVLR